MSRSHPPAPRLVRSHHANTTTVTDPKGDLTMPNNESGCSEARWTKLMDLLAIGSYVSAAVDLDDGTHLDLEGELGFVGVDDSAVAPRKLHLGVGAETDHGYMSLPETVQYEHRDGRLLIEAAVGNATVHLTTR